MLDVSILSWGDSGWGDEFFFATLMTLAVAGCSFLLGLVIAIVVAAMKLSRNPALIFLANSYTTFIRGIPELLVIYLIFYGSNSLIMNIASTLFGIEGYIELPVFLMGVVCIGLSSGAYSTEVIRGAVQTVPTGTLEAAKAIGMPVISRFTRILVPQAIRFALPGLGNVWQLTLKETSLISVIGLTEIVRVSQVGAGSEKMPFLFFTTGLLLFLLLASLSNKGYKLLEARAEKGVRVK